MRAASVISGALSGNVEDCSFHHNGTGVAVFVNRTVVTTTNTTLRLGFLFRRLNRKHGSDFHRPVPTTTTTHRNVFRIIVWSIAGWVGADIGR